MISRTSSATFATELLQAMDSINLKYGDSSFEFVFDPKRFDVLGKEIPSPALSDIELGERIDSPIGCGRLEDIVSPGETVLFVVPDASRRTGAGQIINLLVRRLIANGTAPHEMAVVIATGIHRGVTDEEKREILTPFITQRLKVHVHSARDLMQTAGLKSDKFTDFGVTGLGTPVRLNRLLTDYDRVIAVGGVSFHYFAGFTGGRKLICPGLAAEETVAATHRLAFDAETLSRREGVGPAALAGNAVHEEFLAAAGFRPPDFSIDTIVDDSGTIVDVFCGDWIGAHETACAKYADSHVIELREKRDIVIVSCGGFPHDINMIQAHKALDSAAGACKEGGTIVLLAECRDGLGRSDFIDWFAASDSTDIARKLCAEYQVNGQTAWSLLKKCEAFEVRMVTSLDKEDAEKMRIKKCGSLEAALDSLPPGSGYLLPNGAKFLVREK